MAESPQPEIPWSVAWSDERGFRLQPSVDFPGLLELDQQQALGSGEPVFALIHLTRQRRGMIDLLCHVCGGPTASEDRWIFPAASGGLVTLLDCSQQFGCNVPPMHRACAERAAVNCPHLAKVDETPLRCGPDAGRLIHRTDTPAELEALAATFPPNVEVVFSCYRLYGPEFTAEVLAARARWEEASRRRRGRTL